MTALTSCSLGCCAAILALASCSPSSTPARDTAAAQRPISAQADSIGAAGRFVANCEPCSIRVLPGAEPFELRFILDSTGIGHQERMLRRVVVSRVDRPARQQGLSGTAFPVASVSDSFFVIARDFNADRISDLAVMTSQGVANAYFDYWVFRPTADSFAFIGNLPFLAVDSASGHLSSYERGGDGGRIFTRRTYAFVRDSLTAIEVDEQRASRGGAMYIRTLDSLRGGALRRVRTDTSRSP